MEEVKAKVRSMKRDTEALLARSDLDPAARIGLESVLSHLTLLAIELGLDIE